MTDQPHHPAAKRERIFNLLLGLLLAVSITRLWLMPLPSSFWVDEMATAFVVHHGPNDPSFAVAPQVPAKPKAASKPAPQKSYALLSDVQIAGIKDRLRLSASQEPYWPAVETALRAVARKIHAKREAEPNASGMPVDPDSEEVQQLKSAAMPLLFQLREDQKDEVRRLARIIGLEKVAAAI